MTIELPDEAQAFVESQLATGHYADEREVVIQALAMWEDYQKRAAEIRAKVQEGIDAADAGRSTKISTPEEAEVFAQQIITRAKERWAARDHDMH